MTAWFGAAFVVVGFLALIRQLAIPSRGRGVIAVAGRVVEVIRSAELDDDAKELALQAAAKALLRSFFAIALGGALALLLPPAVLWVFDRFGWLSVEAVFAILMSPAVLLTTTAAVLVVLLMPGRSSREVNEYSLADRSLHRLAFATTAAQVSLSDLEDRLFAEPLRSCSSSRPVFITALPRAGTTLLLEHFAKLPEFAAHTYRDMPFILVPCLWSRFSRMFQSRGTQRERAHGDGMLIDFDSPEAFEEMLWKAFWRKHYRQDRILPWSDEDHEDFSDFFHSHIRKVILLRRGDRVDGVRYVSKNNLNIARAPAIRRLFPDATIVVPFRDPIQHAASLLTQHRSFTRIHDEDSFARDYMRGIGHFDFGRNLRPIDFDGWLDMRKAERTDSLAFWLEYWRAAYAYLMRDAKGVRFLHYDSLCRDPNAWLGRLALDVASSDPESFVTGASAIRELRPRDVDLSGVDQSLLHAVKEVYGALIDASGGEA